MNSGRSPGATPVRDSRDGRPTLESLLGSAYTSRDVALAHLGALESLARDPTVVSPETSSLSAGINASIRANAAENARFNTAALAELRADIEQLDIIITEYTAASPASDLSIEVLEARLGALQSPAIATTFRPSISSAQVRASTTDSWGGLDPAQCLVGEFDDSANALSYDSEVVGINMSHGGSASIRSHGSYRTQATSPHGGWSAASASQQEEEARVNGTTWYSQWRSNMTNMVRTALPSRRHGGRQLFAGHEEESARERLVPESALSPRRPPARTSASSAGGDGPGRERERVAAFGDLDPVFSPRRPPGRPSGSAGGNGYGREREHVDDDLGLASLSDYERSLDAAHFRDEPSPRRRPTPLGRGGDHDSRRRRGRNFGGGSGGSGGSGDYGGHGGSRGGSVPAPIHTVAGGIQWLRSPRSTNAVAHLLGPSSDSNHKKDLRAMQSSKMPSKFQRISAPFFGARAASDNIETRICSFDSILRAFRETLTSFGYCPLLLLPCGGTLRQAEDTWPSPNPVYASFDGTLGVDYHDMGKVSFVASEASVTRASDYQRFFYYHASDAWVLQTQLAMAFLVKNVHSDLLDYVYRHHERLPRECQGFMSFLAIVLKRITLSDDAVVSAAQLKLLHYDFRHGDIYKASSTILAMVNWLGPSRLPTGLIPALLRRLCRGPHAELTSYIRTLSDNHSMGQHVLPGDTVLDQILYLLELCETAFETRVVAESGPEVGGAFLTDVPEVDEDATVLSQLCPSDRNVFQTFLTSLNQQRERNARPPLGAADLLPPAAQPCFWCGKVTTPPHVSSSCPSKLAGTAQAQAGLTALEAFRERRRLMRLANRSTRGPPRRSQRDTNADATSRVHLANLMDQTLAIEEADAAATDDAPEVDDTPSEDVTDDDSVGMALFAAMTSSLVSSKD